MTAPQGSDVCTFKFHFTHESLANTAMRQLARADLSQQCEGTVITLRALRFEVKPGGYCLIHFGPGRYICFTLAQALVSALQDGKVIWNSGQS